MDLREVINSYRLRLAMLSRDLLPWQTVQSYFYRWQENELVHTCSSGLIGSCHHAGARVEAGRMSWMRRCLSPAQLAEVALGLDAAQNWSDCPKKAPKRMDMAGVIERLV